MNLANILLKMRFARGRITLFINSFCVMRPKTRPVGNTVGPFLERRRGGAAGCCPVPAVSTGRGSGGCSSQFDPWNTTSSPSSVSKDTVALSVVDPYWFQCGSWSSIFCHCGSGSGSRVLITKGWKKITAEKIVKSFYFFMKNCNWIILRPP